LNSKNTSFSDVSSRLNYDKVSAYDTLPLPSLGKNSAVLKQTGARQVLNPESERAWEVLAPKAYERIRQDTDDVAAIASNTGWSADRIARIKNHLFTKEHLFADGSVQRFDADPQIVNSLD